MAIVERLARLGVPNEFLDRQGLIAYVRENQVDMAELIAAIFPTEENAAECLSDTDLEELFQESMAWLKWLMFKGDPGIALEELCRLNANEQSACRVIFGDSDTAYRCGTCEQDPSCAICVSCFKNGDHAGHNYSTELVIGGCCDCGDASSWKSSGFCLNHRGSEQIQPLPTEFSNSMGHVLDSLFCFWRNRLVSDHISQNVREDLTYAVVEPLLEFCERSESLLSFISEKLLSLHGFLEILVKVEQQFSSSDAVQTLHELLLKLLGDPRFKYEFTKVYLGYYPTVVTESIKESNDEILRRYPLLREFAVQIFPTLTLQLVKELNPFPVLLECLENIFISCSGDDRISNINNILRVV